MPTLIEQYQALHDKGHFAGLSLRVHLPEIKRCVAEYGAESLLDYGCGKAQCWLEEGAAETVGIVPTLYDPGFKPFARRPYGVFDAVICTDVLEHVEDPEWVIEDLKSLATKFLFIAICCRPSEPHKVLPDGRPVHIQVHPPQWWRDRIRADIPVVLRFEE